MASPFLAGVFGPTASGKTLLAERLAGELGARLLNCDAFQIYRGMDIGTAKPVSREKYRLLDIRNPDEGFGVGEYVLLASQVLMEEFAAGGSVVLVGGTGLYYRALMEGYANMAAAPDPEIRGQLDKLLLDQGVGELARRLQEISPEAAAETDLQNPTRVRRALERALGGNLLIKFEIPPYRRIKLGLDCDRTVLTERIEMRTRQMVQNGWSHEVQTLVGLGYRPEDPGFRALGYRDMYRHVQGEIGLAEVLASTVQDTVRYAKRQRTWMRSEPNLNRISDPNPDVVFDLAMAHLGQAL